MTLEQTRQLGIEFERRIQALMPTEEFSYKLDTETIYAYLNEYQTAYVHGIYRSLDKLEDDASITAQVESILQSMMTSTTLLTKDIDDNNTFLENVDDTDAWNDVISDSARSKTWALPNNYCMYIRSVSNVSKTYSWSSDSKDKTNVIPNVYVKQSNVWNVLETPYNNLRILRQPIVVLPQYVNIEETKTPTVTVIHDRYTDIDGVKIIYYKQPQYFSLMTSTPCELPMDAFEDLVSGAVQLYLNYATGQIKQQQRASKKAKEDVEKDQDRDNTKED